MVRAEAPESEDGLRGVLDAEAALQALVVAARAEAASLIEQAEREAHERSAAVERELEASAAERRAASERVFEGRLAEIRSVVAREAERLDGASVEEIERLADGVVAALVDRAAPP